MWNVNKWRKRLRKRKRRRKLNYRTPEEIARPSAWMKSGEQLPWSPISFLKQTSVPLKSFASCLDMLSDLSSYSNLLFFFVCVLFWQNLCLLPPENSFLNTLDDRTAFSGILLPSPWTFPFAYSAASQRCSATPLLNKPSSYLGPRPTQECSLPCHSLVSGHFSMFPNK